MRSLKSDTSNGNVLAPSSSRIPSWSRSRRVALRQAARRRALQNNVAPGWPKSRAKFSRWGFADGDSRLKRWATSRDPGQPCERCEDNRPSMACSLWGSPPWESQCSPPRELRASPSPIRGGRGSKPHPLLMYTKNTYRFQTWHHRMARAPPSAVAVVDPAVAYRVLRAADGHRAVRQLTASKARL